MQKSDLPFGSEFSPSQIELPELLDLVYTRNSELLKRLGSREHNVSGLALTAAALKLLDLLDMQFVATHSHWEPTEENAVRLIVESEQPVFSRWQVRCKKTELLTLDDVAIEVGLTYLSKSNVIVMISTGNIEDTAQLYADKVMRTSNLCIVMLDGTDLDVISADPIHIKQIFRRETQRARRLRQLDI